MKIALYLGGTSAERDVSLQSGKFIGRALKEIGHQVLYVDPALSPEKNKAQLGDDYQITDSPPSLDELEEMVHTNIFRLLLEPEIAGCDFHFIALHGGIGENGLLQGMFEYLGYDFNGPGHSASAAAMDKHLSKQIMLTQNIPTPDWNLVTENQWKENSDDIRDQVNKQFTVPYVVKPNSQGSTIGLTIVSETGQITSALDRAFQFDNRTLVEQYIPGRELTAAILGEQELPLVEIKPQEGLYDYRSKYTAGLSQYDVPAGIQNELRDQIQGYAFRLFSAIGAAGYSRVDFRLSEDDQPYCLEVNTLPGMTNTSLVPKAAKSAGINFKDLLSQIIDLGQTK